MKKFKYIATIDWLAKTATPWFWRNGLALLFAIATLFLILLAISAI